MLGSTSFVRSVSTFGASKKLSFASRSKRTVSAPNRAARTLKRMFSSEQVEERLKAHGLEWPGPVRCVFLFPPPLNRLELLFWSE